MDVVDDDHHLNNSSDPKPKRPRNDFEVNEFPAMSTFFDNDSIEDENVTTAGGWSIISTATGQTNVATAAGGSRSSATGEVKIWNDSKNDSGDRWNYSDEDELPDLEQQGEAVVKMEESSIAVASATTWDRIAHKFRDRSSLFNYVTVKLVDMYYNGDCDNGSRSLFDKSGSTSDDNMDLEESEKGEMVIKAVDASASRRRRVLEQMYAEGPAMNQLFEGVSDAVHRLHKAVTECPEETQETSDPSGLMIPLMQHQRQALTWILWREKQVPGGGILADDMGLGKTLTMIALILMKKQLRNQVQEEPDENLKVVLNRKDLVPSNTTLVVCPASVMHQWKNEIERRVKPGYLKIHLFHGDRKKRERYPYRLAQFDIVLTTYGLVASEIGEPELPPDVECNESCDEKLWREIRMEKSNDSVLSRVAWERIILDEAHVIRNYKTSTAKGCCRIPAGSRWCLSGTPLHNDLMDLYSLLRFLRCSPFDEKRVWKIYIQDNRSRESKVRLSTIVKSLLLRRTKEQKSGTHGKPIIELTEKKFHIHNINLTKPEKSIYDRMHKFSQRKVEAFVNHQEHREDRELVVFSKGQCTSEKEKLTWKNPFLIYKKDKDGQVEQIDILVLLLRLRQACVHYALTKNALDMKALKEDCGIEKEFAQQQEEQQQGGSLTDSLRDQP